MDSNKAWTRTKRGLKQSVDSKNSVDSKKKANTIREFERTFSQCFCVFVLLPLSADFKLADICQNVFKTIPYQKQLTPKTFCF